MSRTNSFDMFGGDHLDGLLAHTPPQFTPCSYEKSHMKRPRARSRSGSISLRLRSASELEDKGLIDGQQKRILKNMIMNGDPSLQMALEKYESGDPTALEALMDSAPQGNFGSSQDLEWDEELDWGPLSLKDEPQPRRSEEVQDQDFMTQFTFDEDTSLSNGHDPISLQHDDPIGGSILDGHGFDMSVQHMSGHVGPDDFESMIDGLSEDKFHQLSKSKHKKPSAKTNPVSIRRKMKQETLAGDDSDDEEGSSNGKVGAYSPESRKARIERFLEKRKQRVWKQPVKYNVRKDFANSRLRVKGRFVKKEEETLLRELLQMT